jgi:hypothetical protein
MAQHIERSNMALRAIRGKDEPCPLIHLVGALAATS